MPSPVRCPECGTPTTSSADEPLVLNYASPMPGVRRRRASWYLGACICCIGVFAVLFIPSTYGSGVTRQNPPAALAGYLIWFASVVYIWLRVFDERPTSRMLATIIGVCGTVAVIAVPLQLRAWVGDPGHPQPTFRPALLGPGIVATIALLGAGVGCMQAHRGDRLRRRNSRYDLRATPARCPECGTAAAALGVNAKDLLK